MPRSRGRSAVWKPLRKGEESVMEYSGLRLRDLPDRVFTKDYLQRLE